MDGCIYSSMNHVCIQRGTSSVEVVCLMRTSINTDISVDSPLQPN